MDERWKGLNVTIDCGDILGTYQGVVAKVDPTDQSVVLRNVYRNGVKWDFPEISVSAKDIRDIEIINSIVTAPHVPSAKSNSHAKETDSEQTMESTGSSGERATPPKLRNNFRRKRAKSFQGSNNNNQSAFDEPIESMVEEFDFEKNLALFDKRAVAEEVHGKNGDRKQPTTPSAQRNYRHDEMIFKGQAPNVRPTQVPEKSKKIYKTDSGASLPTISEELRRRLIVAALDCGLSMERQIEAMGRCSAEMVIQLIGGVGRLQAKYSHQRPVLIILCNSMDLRACYGLCCARYLTSRAMEVAVFLQLEASIDPLLNHELSLLAKTHCKVISSSSELPTEPVDIIINTLDPRNQSEAIATWASRHERAPIFNIDPPSNVGALLPKWSLMPILPRALSQTDGIYLCDLGFPKEAFSRCKIQYESPFEAKFIIPLYND